MASIPRPSIGSQNRGQRSQPAITPLLERVPAESAGAPASSSSVRHESIGHNQPNRQIPHELYANVIFSFASRSSETLYSGEHYRALAKFLVTDVGQPSLSYNAVNVQDGDAPEFVVAHVLRTGNGVKKQIFLWKSYDDFANSWDTLEGNRLVFLRGYPSAEWLSRLGRKLSIDYEFLYQHFSNPTQLSVGEAHCLPPLSLLGTDSIQLTFTSIGSWDNHASGVDLATARTSFNEEMKAFTADLNRGLGPKTCDSIVRSFFLHDLKHFSIEQMLSIRLLVYEGNWTILIWTDYGDTLSKSHRGPWLEIQQKHSSSTRFLPAALHYNNVHIRKLTASANKMNEREEASPRHVQQTGFVQNVSFLDKDFGKTIDLETVKMDPFYALDEFFRLLAASEHQFLNLMETKVREYGQLGGNNRDSIAEIQLIKKLVDKHAERLHDTLDIVHARGGPSWRKHSSISNPDATNNTIKGNEAAVYLESIFGKLCRRADAVSGACQDEVMLLSNDSVVHEAQRSIEQTEGLAKVTFIAFVFVPLSFTTSFFGMNLAELNGIGQHVYVWFAVSTPVMALSLLAWWMDEEKRGYLSRAVRSSWRLLRKGAEDSDTTGDGGERKEKKVLHI